MSKYAMIERILASEETPDQKQKELQDLSDKVKDMLVSQKPVEADKLLKEQRKLFDELNSELKPEPLQSVHAVLNPISDEEAWGHIKDEISKLWNAFNKLTDPELSKRIEAFDPEAKQAIVKCFHDINSLHQKAINSKKYEG